MVGLGLILTIGGYIGYLCIFLGGHIHINKKLCAINTAKVSFLNGDHKNRGRQAHSPFL